MVTRSACRYYYVYGNCSGQIDEDLPAFSVSVDVSGLTDVTGVHVHDGGIGMNGPVAFPLTDAGNGTYVLAETNISPSNLDALTSGEWYLNVHTTANPNGEVRGQIVPDTTAVVTFSLAAAEVPAVDTMAMGSGYALSTPQTTTFSCGGNHY